MENGEWRQDFKIYDHLGSVRVVLRKKTPLEFLNDPTFPPTYYTVGQYNYEPFGEQTKNTDNSDRLGFINKEKDVENDLGDFGVRKYDESIGPFTNTDKLFEKYASWTPYQYSLNNHENIYRNRLACQVINLRKNYLWETST